MKRARMTEPMTILAIAPSLICFVDGVENGGLRSFNAMVDVVGDASSRAVIVGEMKRASLP